MQEIIDRIQPGIRRDCNYFNIDKIKMQSKWDENEQRWIMPKLVIERTSLPGGMSHAFNTEINPFPNKPW